jgi:hypothetical protein
MGAGGWGAGARGPGPFGRSQRAGGPEGQRRFQLMDRLLPLIAKDHPDLARRLAQLREDSPAEFERVLGDALAIRFEEALERRGQPPIPPGMPLGPERGDREWRERHEGFEREMGEFQQRNEELERRTQELARRYDELRERPEPELGEQRDELRRQIAEVVEEHFSVRSELRKLELRRVEGELDRLREMVERIRDDIERREQARGAIIERRLRQLLGEEGSDW